MASKVDICNLALRSLGATTITSLTEDSVEAAACNGVYEIVKRAELRKHPWSFAITRESLAADATAPEFGRENAFQLPSDFIRLLSDYEERNTNDVDWVIEGRKIYTNDSAPLEVRYIYDVTDPTEFDALFCKVLAYAIALELCEQLTQSNTKKAGIKEEYKDTIAEAKRVNAIEKTADRPPSDPWITARD